MKLIGIPLRIPAFAELTAATIRAVGLWPAAVELLLASRVALGRADVGALLRVLGWACLGARMGANGPACGGGPGGGAASRIFRRAGG